MKRRVFSFHSALRVFLAGVIIFSAGCSLLKKLLVKPPPEGVTENSYTIRMVGFKETVTVKTSPQELVAFMSDPINWFRLAGMKVPVGAAAAPKPTAFAVGTSFPFEMKKMGVKTSGRMIVVRVTEEELWLVWDNPMMLHFQRWKFEPAPEGSRLTLDMVTEVQEQGLGQVVEDLGIVDSVNRGIDTMLAGIQVHFDPSLKVADLIKVGLRGESYETLLQACSAQVEINAPPRRVEQWITDPANFRTVLPELKLDDSAFAWLQKASPGDVLYAPGALEMGVLKLSADLFLVKGQKSKGQIAKVYLVTASFISIIELEAVAVESRSQVTVRYQAEIPSGMSADSMELLSLVARVPQLIQERTLLIKKGVEK